MSLSAPPPGDAVVSFTVERWRVPPATQIRSTWLISSQAALRERGHFDAYDQLLPPLRRVEVLGVVPGQWLPIETAVAHYEACDGLGLTDEEVVEMGEAATRRALTSTLAVFLKLARVTGVTPWTFFGQADKLYERTACGGQVAVFRLGPKDARLEVAGFPLARFRYVRVAVRGIIQAMTGALAERAYVREVPALCSASTLGYVVSWA